MKQKPVQVLLVEDNPGDARLLREMLANVSSARFALTHVERLRLALEHLETKRFDVVLLDLSLPDAQGLDTFVKIHARAPRVPIVVLTGLDDEALALQVVRGGAQDYLLKGEITAGGGNLLARAIRYAIERQHIEGALRESERTFHSIVEQSTDAIVLADEQGNVIEWNQSAEQITGLTWTEVLGRPLWEVQFQMMRQEQKTPQTLEQISAMLASLLETGQAPWLCKPYETRIQRPDGTQRTVQISGFSVPTERGVKIGSTIRDVTEHKQAEERIRASLQEKEVLLKEVHHRVKNNLQVISSLLKLQARSIDDPQARQTFQDSCNRVKAMGLVHERLYRAQDLTSINAAEYVQDLVAHVFAIYGDSANAIALVSQVEGVTLSVDAAIPCGLIVTELVSNALRHAFPPGENNGREIRVELASAGANRFTLLVGDNGAGLPPDFNLDDPPSLGLQLVNLLTRQLGGTIALGKSSGAVFEITFADTAREPSGEMGK